MRLKRRKTGILPHLITFKHSDTGQRKVVNKKKNAGIYTCLVTGISSACLNATHLVHNGQAFFGMHFYFGLFFVCYFWFWSQMRPKSLAAYRIITHFSRSNKGHANNSILCNSPRPAPLQTSHRVKCEVVARADCWNSTVLFDWSLLKRGQNGVARLS